MTTKPTPNKATSAVIKSAFPPLLPRFDKNPKVVVKPSTASAFPPLLPKPGLFFPGAGPTPTGLFFPNAGTGKPLTATQLLELAKQQAAAKKAADEAAKKAQTLPDMAAVISARRKKAVPKAGCQFNLPPHAWSLPVRPSDVVGTELLYQSTSSLDAIHRERRGMIWFYDTGASTTVTDETGNSKTAEEAKAEKLKGKTLAAAYEGTKDDFNYGFQFLWNPDQISVAVARNMEVTPSSADRLRSVSGAFPGQESVQFNIVIDRVNDFAALKAESNKPDNGAAYPNYTDDFVRYYKYGYSDAAALKKTSMNQKIYELSRFGTLADLEYLFKAINSAGPAGGWHTLLGKKTADIGFLAPTLLAFRFGPDAQESLSFVGWITNLSISHVMFTENMIPLRTNVSFSVDCFAGSSIV